MKAVTSWVLGGLLGAGIGLGLAQAMPGLLPAQSPVTGSVALMRQMAPDFDLPTPRQGKPITLSEYRGKVVLLNFFETTCPHCQGEIPELVKLHQALRSKGVEVIGVSLDGVEARELAALAKAKHVTYPLAMGNEEVATRYGGIDGVPMSFLIDREGRIVEVFSGAAGYEALVKAVRAHL